MKVAIQVLEETIAGLEYTLKEIDRDMEHFTNEAKKKETWKNKILSDIESINEAIWKLQNATR